jgi:hypothetical protein
VTIRRSAPTLLAGALALAYLIVSPPSVDLAAELLRAKLFGAAPFGLWNNWWYGGHAVLSYSALFPPAAWALTPQLVAASAATASTAVFTALAYDRYGEHAECGCLWFAAASATNLLSGRLTFAAGLLPALAAVLALARGRPALAAALAAISALVSPVAALFAALAGAANAAGAPSRRNIVSGAVVVVAALAPVLAIALAFGGGGREPFAFSAFWPVPVVVLLLWLALGAGSSASSARSARSACGSGSGSSSGSGGSGGSGSERTLRAGLLLYALGVTAAFALPTPVGGNAARLAPLLAGPLLALVWWPRRRALLLALALPLLYLQWQAAVRDLTTAAGDPSTSAAYYRPLLGFLQRQGGAPFRIEIPFTATHWEAYEVAPRFPLARGWERQLDLGYNGLFYDGTLTAARYENWLHSLAVRFVAVPDVAFDYSAKQEVRLIIRGLTYLHLTARLAHWRVYAVAQPTPIVQGVAVLRTLGPGSLTLRVRARGRALVRVRYSPYWKLSGPAAPGACVAPAGQFSSLTLPRPGTVQLVIDFSLSRIGAHSPRCNPR